MDYVNFVNLQCKTNWNDNAQVPMLWDIIYSSNEKLNNISVGINGVSPHSLTLLVMHFQQCQQLINRNLKRIQ